VIRSAIDAPLQKARASQAAIDAAAKAREAAIDAATSGTPAP
jgi:hypothetical protein